MLILLLLFHDGHTLNSNQVSDDVILKYVQKCKKNPQDIQAWFTLGKHSLEKGRHQGNHFLLQQSYDAFKRVTELHPSHLAAKLGRVKALMGGHQFRKALEELRQISLQVDSNQEMLCLYFDIHLSLGNYMEAKVFSESLEKSFPGFQSQVRQAQALEAFGHHQESVDLYKSAIKQENATHSEQAWCWTMIAQLGFQIDLNLAQTAIGSAKKMDPNMTHAHFQEAQLLIFKGQPNQAIAILKSCIQKQPRIEYEMELWKAYLKADQTHQAHHLRRHLITRLQSDFKKGDLGHQLYLAELLLEHQPELAAKYATNEWKHVRQDLNTAETLAWALHRSNRSGEAVKFVKSHMNHPGISSDFLAKSVLILHQQGHIIPARILNSRLQKVPDFGLNPKLKREIDHLDFNPLQASH